MATNSWIDKSDTSLTFQVTDATALSVSRTVHWKIEDTGAKIDGSIPANSTTSNKITFTGLTPGTTYTIKCYINNPDPIADWENYRTATTTGTKPQPRPVFWTWTTDEINAFNNKGKTTTLTMSRWNSFVGNVRDVAEWYYKYDCSYLNNSKIYDGILTATKFNAVKNAIKGMSSGVSVPEVSKGYIVYGWYFINLSTALNSVK